MIQKAATPKTYAPQDLRIADRIAAARQLIEAALRDAVIAAILDRYGYDAAAFGTGLALQQNAQETFNARQRAMAARRQTASALRQARAAARRAYADFRRVARAIYTNPTDRTALALRGIVPDDDQKFLTLARASYAAAAREPYQAVLAVYGYTVETLAAAVAGLDAFSAAADAHNTAAAAAKRATAERNAAVKALDAWVSQFTQIARVYLRARPDLVEKLFA